MDFCVFPFIPSNLGVRQRENPCLWSGFFPCFLPPIPPPKKNKSGRLLLHFQGAWIRGWCRWVIFTIWTDAICPLFSPREGPCRNPRRTDFPVNLWKRFLGGFFGTFVPEKIIRSKKSFPEIHINIQITDQRLAVSGPKLRTAKIWPSHFWLCSWGRMRPGWLLQVWQAESTKRCDPSDHLQESPGPPGPKSQKRSQKESLWGSAKKSPKIPEKVPKYPQFWTFQVFSGTFCGPQKRLFLRLFCDFGPGRPGDSSKWSLGSQTKHVNCNPKSPRFFDGIVPFEGKATMG